LKAVISFIKFGSVLSDTRCTVLIKITADVLAGKLTAAVAVVAMGAQRKVFEKCW
jgi:hypothetical protein